MNEKTSSYDWLKYPVLLLIILSFGVVLLDFKNKSHEDSQVVNQVPVESGVILTEYNSETEVKVLPEPLPAITEEVTEGSCSESDTCFESIAVSNTDSVVTGSLENSKNIEGILISVSDTSDMKDNPIAAGSLVFVELGSFKESLSDTGKNELAKVDLSHYQSAIKNEIIYATAVTNELGEFSTSLESGSYVTCYGRGGSAVEGTASFSSFGCSEVEIKDGESLGLYAYYGEMGFVLRSNN